MRIAYFEGLSGISGDMTVGALLDAGRGRGADLGQLREALATLALRGYEIAAEPVLVGGIRATAFHVEIDSASHAHHHRDWSAIRSMIEDAGRAGLPAGATERALAIFAALARAEAAVHAVDVERVHFHEVGAVDSIVDIVGAAWCLDALGIEACFVSPLPSGSGYVMSEHGRLPVPAPATVRLLAGFEIVAGDGEGELVTPTGAAILAATAKPLRPSFRLEASGCGAGTRRLADRPNVLRVLLGEAEAESDEEVVVIEAEIDDMTPAALAHAAERLRSAGARDVSLLPVQMKKGRLGMRLTVLADLARLDALAGAMLAATTTLGVRYTMAHRSVLPRRIERVHTEFGEIAVKLALRPDGRETAEPEFEDVARAARAHGRKLLDVRAAALAALAKR